MDWNPFNAIFAGVAAGAAIWSAIIARSVIRKADEADLPIAALTQQGTYADLTAWRIEVRNRGLASWTIDSIEIAKPRGATGLIPSQHQEYDPGHGVVVRKPEDLEPFWQSRLEPRLSLSAAGAPIPSWGGGQPDRAYVDFQVRNIPDGQPIVLFLKISSTEATQRRKTIRMKRELKAQ